MQLTIVYALTGFIVGIVLLPIIRYWGIKLKFVDKPNTRKVHVKAIPALGGVAVFFGIASYFALLPTYTSPFLYWKVFMLLITILFITGLLDDKFELPSFVRLIIQLSCATAIVLSGIKITSLYGFLGFDEIPTSLQIPLSIVIIAGVTNAFNLIDGIDGLAGGLSFINATVLSVICYTINMDDLALFFAALAGVLFSFLVYNFHPAKLFMGDSGSLVLGFIFSAIGIYIIDQGEVAFRPVEYNVNVVIGLLALPVFDTLRLFAERLLKGKSPFSADKNHIHHIILNKYSSHMKASYIIYFIHIIFVATALLSAKLPLAILLCILIFEYLLCIFWYRYQNSSKKTETKSLAYSKEDK